MRTIQPSLVILAAGMGSRYGGLKQVDSVGPSGETILDYSIHDALAAGFGKIVFVIRRDIEKDFKRIVGARYEDKVSVEYVYQQLDTLPQGFSPPGDRVKPWGTGHAILMAESVVAEPFAVINADDFYGRDAYASLAGFLRQSPNPGEYAMIGYKLRNTLSENGSVSRGVCQLDTEGYLKEIEEITAIVQDGQGARAGEHFFNGEERVSMNLWGFEPGVFRRLEAQFCAFLKERGNELKSEFYIPFAVDEQIQSGDARVRVLETEGKWAGVTYREDKTTVEAFIRDLVKQGEYPVKLGL